MAQFDREPFGDDSVVGIENCKNSSVISSTGISVHDNLNEPLLENHGDQNTNGVYEQKDRQKHTKTIAGDKTSVLQTETVNDDITEYNFNVNDQTEGNILIAQDKINTKESLIKCSPQIDTEKQLSANNTNNRVPVCYQKTSIETTSAPSSECANYNFVDQNTPHLTATTSAKSNNEINAKVNKLDISVHDNLNEPILDDHGDENINGRQDRQKDDKTSKLQTVIDIDDITVYNVNVNEQAEDNIKTVQDNINIKESITKFSRQIESLESIQESQTDVIIPSLKSPIGENNKLVSKSFNAVSPKKNLLEEANNKPLSPTRTSILEPEERLSPSNTNNTVPVGYQKASLEATNSSSRESADYDKVDQNPPILTATTSAKCNNGNIVNAKNLDISVHDNLNQPILEDHGNENTNARQDRQKDTKTAVGDKTSKLQTEIDNDVITEYNVNINEQAEDNIKTVQNDINIKESITKCSPQLDSFESIQESQTDVIIPSLKSPSGENNKLVFEIY
ncbi:uncharacterized protein LOC135439640 [Drosophila montana]|uniref:uncharacterized protein LOC135439640 n=1 Tax=Drosophila montana TaxID=40370 RepID=UPI00313D68C4